MKAPPTPKNPETTPPMTPTIVTQPQARLGPLSPLAPPRHVRQATVPAVVARKTAKGHLGEILPQGDLDDGTVGQLLKELTGEMDRPSDRKRRIWGYGDLTWMLEGIFSSGMMLSSRWS